MMSTMDGRAALIAAGLSAVTLVAAAVLRRSARDEVTWPGARYLALALLLLAVGEAAILVAELGGATPLGPGSLDVLFLLPLVPFARAARDAYRAHLPGRELAEVEADVVLIMGALASILYLVIRPIGADPGVSGSAMVFAIDAAVLTSLFSGLALRAPSRPHALLFLVLAGM